MGGKVLSIRGAAAVVLLAFAACAAAAQTGGRAAMMANGHVGDCASCHGGKGENRYAFDASQSRILFSVENFGFGRATGVIGDIGGGFLFDPKHVEKSSVLASIRAGSLDTANALLDAVLLSGRFLDADHHRFITFESTRVQRTGAERGRLFGTLTVRGIARPVVLDVAFNKAGRHPVTGEYLAGFTATGIVKRSAFGMTLGLPVIGDEVSLTVEVVGRRLE